MARERGGSSRSGGSTPAALTAAQAGERARFAKLLNHTLSALKVRNTWVAQRMDWHVTTVSRYRHGKQGPPSEGEVRYLESELGLPAGYFSGRVEADLVALRKRLHAPRKPGSGARPEIAAHSAPSLPAGNEATILSVLEGLKQHVAALEVLLVGGAASRFVGEPLPEATALAGDRALRTTPPPPSSHRRHG